MSTDFSPAIKQQIDVLPNINFAKIAIVVSEWYYDEINLKMLQGALEVLKQKGVAEGNIIIKRVPGSFELPLAAQWFLEYNLDLDAVICLGCVIKGETRHNEYISQAVANEIEKLNTRYRKPVIFGVLTTEDFNQAQARAGGKHGNKGFDAGIAAIQMIDLHKYFKNNYSK